MAQTFTNLLTHIIFTRKIECLSSSHNFGLTSTKAAEVMRYIANQEQHHRKRTFQEEFLAFLRRNNIEYDEGYIWQ